MKLFKCLKINLNLLKLFRESRLPCRKQRWLLDHEAKRKQRSKSAVRGLERSVLKEAAAAVTTAEPERSSSSSGHKGSSDGCQIVKPEGSKDSYLQAAARSEEIGSGSSARRKRQRNSADFWVRKQKLGFKYMLCETLPVFRVIKMLLEIGLVSVLKF